MVGIHVPHNNGDVMRCENAEKIIIESVIIMTNVDGGDKFPVYPGKEL